MPEATTVCLVSCVKRKRPGQHAAADLYVSDWFLKARSFAATTASRWFILSAKYGLLDPAQEVVSYEQTLLRMSAAERKTWADQVLCKLLPELQPGDRVIFLAGLAYRQFLVEPIRRQGCEIVVPMEGLGIGKQLRWLGHQGGGHGAG